VIGKLSAQRSIKYNVENLKMGTGAKECRNKVEELLQILPNTKDPHVEVAWEDIKQAICKAADILGQKPITVRNGWYDEECKEIPEEQNNARLKMLQRKTRSNIKAYKEVRREPRKLCRRKKNWKNYKRNIKEIG
jgi:uncharacterized protein YaaR (DUF327 family)